MKIHTVQADAELGLSRAFSFVVSAQSLDVDTEECVMVGPVDIAGTIVNTGKVYRVEGIARLKKSVRCGRCLKQAEQMQEIPFREEYGRSDEAEADGPVLFSGDFIDLTDLIRETILLSQPLNQLCSPDCRGLCVKCGANLNEADCRCDRHVPDPRLAALQNFLPKK